jgi:predicted  nucleic acid-binding Zn-ribbon protein
LNSEIISLKQQIAKKDKALGEYQSRIPKLLDEKQELLDKVESLEWTIASLKSDVQGKQANINQLMSNLNDN